MNFLDTYEIAGTSPSSPAPTNQPEQSLNEEVSQVLGQLGRFWGGFRKQVHPTTFHRYSRILTGIFRVRPLSWLPERT